MKTLELRCDWCGILFQRNKSEHRRNVALGRKIFCSRSCSASRRNKGRQPNTSGLKRGGKTPDALSPFRWFLARARYRKIKGNTDLTAQSLKQLWDSQEGICPLTGWKLILPDTTAGWPTGPSPRNASLDRIDNSKGYLQGNVRFISLIANLARAEFSDQDVLDFGRAVSQRSPPICL